MTCPEDPWWFCLLALGAMTAAYGLHMLATAPV